MAPWSGVLNAQVQSLLRMLITDAGADAGADH